MRLLCCQEDLVLHPGWCKPHLHQPIPGHRRTLGVGGHAEEHQRGKVSIRLDNRPAAVVDTYSRTTENAVVVWQARFRTGGKWTLTITNLGTPGHPRVDVDAIMIS